MFPIQKIMKEWLSNKCENDEHVERNLRKLIIQDKQLLREINILIQNGTVSEIQDYVIIEIQKLIDSFIESKNLIINLCKRCKSKDLFNTHNIEHHICKKCSRDILKVSYKNITEGKKYNPEQRNVSVHNTSICNSCGFPIDTLGRCGCSD
ncbi:hypothetical protein [Ureibacillus acetophenoni]|uniref:Uncharacterized protein n=1 Tax=Ureibacillus acetophenoni TaxID=614649 RepID=A0A285UB56_9BACL|nr:hypothetical protein [Ureibacillus acetophenoni]SOC39062.1 hypothetical protein SAMN05877842_10528 [Ureibacillus acetophenoni]